jgi:hypothetical protein
MLGSFAVVVLQQTAESLAALDLTGWLTSFLSRFDQSVAKTLMISFRMKVG